MAGKNRDIDAIKEFCKQFRQFCDDVTAEATALKNMALSAESTLKDEVGQRAVRKVEEFSNELIQIVDQGIEPVLELERRNLQMEEDMNRIAGMIR